MLESLERLLLNAYLKETGVDSIFPSFPEETKSLLQETVG
jgi:hypothetical protein